MPSLIREMLFPQGRKLGGISNRKDGFLETKNIQFTYSDLLKITNNFQRVLGKGGFGTVYHGLANGQHVAVKLLSQSSAQGYNEFQTEVNWIAYDSHIITDSNFKFLSIQLRSSVVTRNCFSNQRNWRGTSETHTNSQINKQLCRFANA